MARPYIVSKISIALECDVPIYSAVVIRFLHYDQKTVLRVHAEIHVTTQYNLTSVKSHKSANIVLYCIVWTAYN